MNFKSKEEIIAQLKEKWGALFPSEVLDYDGSLGWNLRKKVGEAHLAFDLDEEERLLLHANIKVFMILKECQNEINGCADKTKIGQLKRMFSYYQMLSATITCSMWWMVARNHQDEFSMNIMDTDGWEMIPNAPPPEDPIDDFIKRESTGTALSGMLI